MRLRSKLIGSLLALTALSSTASAAVIGGSYYAPQYDYAEFFAASDGRNFQVILNGVPALPGVAPNDVANALLPIMQAAKPRPALTFTYADPPERPHPYYRLVLTFDPANDYASSQVCAGVPPRFKQGTPSVFYVFAVYCRNDQVLTETTAWTPANAPNDPRIGELFRQLFPVIFPDSMYRHLNGSPMRR
ncbi:hypothetical protein [Reyranella soli]|jgi:hypothetical protein|uniref:DUF4136 domain-containing protein n=1 Tax=Reyranella soli TaxID=1230389 RepID=A0A512N3C0_9HYPH|nr:hypothetical protein [Reyranella soli]GEP53487.1 hypothetical protein RSO01_06530 [Reyranella soli]